MMFQILLRSIIGLVFLINFPACTPSSSSPPPKNSVHTQVHTQLNGTQSTGQSGINKPSSDLIKQAQHLLKVHDIHQVNSSLHWTQVNGHWVGWMHTQTDLVFIASSPSSNSTDKDSNQKGRLTLKKSKLPSECINSDLCDHWQSTQTFPQNCSQPLIGVQFRHTFTRDTGSKIRLLLYAPFQDSLTLSPLWQDDLRFEQTPTAHSESLFKKTRFINQQQAIKESEVDLKPYLKQTASPQKGLNCAPLFTLSRQSARSFNRVDARETEFYGIEQEVQLFLFKGGRYQLVDIDDEIKIRPF